MPDLTPKIVSITDSAQLLPGGAARETTVIRFMVGTFGPFSHTFDRNPPAHEIDRVMNERQQTLQGRV